MTLPTLPGQRCAGRLPFAFVEPGADAQRSTLVQVVGIGSVDQGQVVDPLLDRCSLQSIKVRQDDETHSVTLRGFSLSNEVKGFFGFLAFLIL